MNPKSMLVSSLALLLALPGPAAAQAMARIVVSHAPLSAAPAAATIGAGVTASQALPSPAAIVLSVSPELALPEAPVAASAPGEDRPAASSQLEAVVAPGSEPGQMAAEMMDGSRASRQTSDPVAVSASAQSRPAGRLMRSAHGLAVAASALSAVPAFAAVEEAQAQGWAQGWMQALAQGDAFAWVPTVITAIAVGAAAHILKAHLHWKSLSDVELRNKLNSQDSADRYNAINEFAKRKQASRHEDALLRLAENDSDEDVREAAVETLSEIKSAAAVPVFVRALERGGSPATAAAKALGETGGAGAVPALLEAARSQDEDLSSAAVDSLIKIGDEEAAKGLARQAERETVRAIRTENWSRAAVSGRMLDRYEESDGSGDEASVAKALDAVWAALTVPNAKAVLDEARRRVSRGETSEFSLSSLVVGTVLIGFWFGLLSSQDSLDGTDLLEKAREDVLSPEGDVESKLSDMDEAAFRKSFAAMFKGHPLLLGVAVREPERRLNILLSLGATREQLSSL